MNRTCKSFLMTAMLVVFLCSTASLASATLPDCQDDWWASCLFYNRPAPHSNADPGFNGARTYDYVPQELGIYDTFYGELLEEDCRGCHGNSLVNRHHLTHYVLELGQCTPMRGTAYICHELDENEPGGVTVTRDCLTAGCHSIADLSAFPAGNGWHHNTDMSLGDACVVCHDRNILGEVTTFRDFEMYPPSIVTPTPFSCENCHWYQDETTNPTLRDGVTPNPSYDATVDTPRAISNITNANPAVVFTTAAHGYAVSDEVVLYGLTGAFAVLNGQTAIGAAGGSQFQIAFDTTAFGAFPGGGAVMRVYDTAATDMVAGHPSDFNHLDYWGNNVGYFEYKKPIKQNATNHMMHYLGNITAGHCERCHGLDPNDTSWLHTNPELIRYCEVCHDLYSLHTIYGHVGTTEAYVANPGPGYPQGAGTGAAGWVATGFHVTGETGLDNPFDYDTFNCYGSPSSSGPDELCLGCHVDQLGNPPIPPNCTAFFPSMEDVEPQFGTCEDIITIRGYNFGDEQLSNSKVVLIGPGPVEYQLAVITDWTDTLLKVRIPCFLLPAPGPYSLRVYNGCNNGSNLVSFAYGSWSSLSSLLPCATNPSGSFMANPWITLSGAGLKDAGLAAGSTIQDQHWTGTDAQGATVHYGVHRTVEFVTSQFPYTGPLVATSYQNWTNTSLEVKFSDFFVDDFLAPETMFPDDAWDYEPESRRDHFNENSPTEEQVPGISGVAMGNMEVYIVATYYRDNNTNGTLDSNDMIFQTITSDPEMFELTAPPYINAIRPRQQEAAVPAGAFMAGLNSALGYTCPNCIITPRTGKLRIFGEYYGTGRMPGDQVRIGDPLNAAPLPLRYDTDGNKYTVETISGGVSLYVGFWASDLIGVYLYPEPGQVLRALYGPDLGIGLNWLDRWLGVWVVKDNCGVPSASNIYPIKVITPLTD